MNETSIFNMVLSNYGPLAAIVAYFFWRDMRKEKHDQTLSDALNTWLRETAMHVIRENTQALANANHVMARIGAAVEANTEGFHRFSDAMLLRPCLHELGERMLFEEEAQHNREEADALQR